MAKLYVIGNGLDLYFGLKTGTKDFENCLQKQRIYGFSGDALDILNSYGVDWSDYEQSLSNLDIDEIMVENEIYPDYLSDHEYDRDEGISNMKNLTICLHDAINNALQEMVAEADNELEVLKESGTPIRLFQSGDAILSFNYTSTLELLFEIPADVQIFHIHGFGTSGGPLIFGYQKGLYEEQWIGSYNEDQDFYITKQREVVYDFYQAWAKQYQLQSLATYLSKHKNINEVVVLGHSMGLVDAEYMNCINQIVQPFEWKISYYDPQKICGIMQQYLFSNKFKFYTIDQLLNNKE